MLENLRDKIQTVQHDLSSSIKGLNIDSDDGKNESHKSKSFTRNKTSSNAGAEILYRYQKKWEESHKITQANSICATEIAKIVTKLNTQTDKHYGVVSEFVGLVSSLDKLKSLVDLLTEDVGTLTKQTAQLENQLTILYDKKEAETVAKFHVDQKYKLAMYKEKQNQKLEELKVKIALEHGNKVKAYEKEHRVVLSERQKAFQEAFEEEITYYKTHGKIDKKLDEIDSPSRTMPLKLEQVEVEENEEDKAALNEFLDSDEHF